MLGELINIPTDTLMDMLYMILAGEVAITASDAGKSNKFNASCNAEAERKTGALQPLTERSEQVVR